VPALSDFKGIHHGGAMVVCGLGNSIRILKNPQRFHTIGVNDIERAFTPTYMFCMDAPKSFAPDRLHYIQHSRAQFIFTDHDLGIAGPNIVKFPIRRADAPRFIDPDALYITGRPITSPFMAICLAAHMGAKAIGLIGVDFTNGHFFAADGTHKLANQLPGIDRRFYQLGNELLDRGVKVFNLSAESRLHAFPRLTLDEFWELQQSGHARSWTRPATRLYFYSALPVSQAVTALTRYINTETSLSCRLSAPGSSDVVPGSMPDIEQSIADASSLDLDCEIAPLPEVSPTRSSFPEVWHHQVKPLLFGCPTPPHINGFKRRLSVGVIVSQERATAEELAETVSSLRNDLRAADEIMVVAARGTAPPLLTLISGTERLRYIEQGAGESFVAARNRAASQCAADILVFTDANVQAPARWVDPLIGAFRRDRVAAVGPALADMYQRDLKTFGLNFSDAELTTSALPRQQDRPYPVPLLAGVFLAVRRRLFEQVAGFDRGMRQSGADDLELCFRLWTSGYECFLVPELSIAWMNPFAAGALRPHQYWQDLLHNLLRLATVHFSPERLGAFIACASLHPEYAGAAAALLSENPRQRQKQVRSARVHSDDWFFERFGG
jgi:hypothetical protein